MRPTIEWLRRAHLLRYGVGTMMLCVSALAIYLALWSNHAGRQKETVDILERAYAEVFYDFQKVGEGSYRDQIAPPSNPIIDLVGVDYFHDVIALNLDSRRMTDDIMKRLGSLRDIETIHISNTSVTDKGLKVLPQLEQLEWLTIDSDDVTDGGMESIGQLRSLRELWLSNVKISDEGLLKLRSLEKLESLSLRGTEVTDDGIAKLRRALPECEIY